MGVVTVGVGAGVGAGGWVGFGVCGAGSLVGFATSMGVGFFWVELHATNAPAMNAKTLRQKMGFL